MLAYLDVLCTALLERDAVAVRRLLGHPLSSALPPAVREEARRVLAAPESAIAPVHTLHFYHQMTHLLGVRAGRAVEGQQFELALREVAS